MKAYQFVLMDSLNGELAMSTEVDEPNPMIDIEFWQRFLEGDCEMLYLGEVEEESSDDSND
jgi:hypothetical protein